MTTTSNLEMRASAPATSPHEEISVKKDIDEAAPNSLDEPGPVVQDTSDSNVNANPRSEHGDNDTDSDDDLNTEYYDVESVAARTDTTGLQSMYGATWRQAMVLTANSGFASGTPRTEGRKSVREGREPELGLARLKGVGRTGKGPAPVPQGMIDALRRAGLVQDDEKVTRLENFTLLAELGGHDIRADGQKSKLKENTPSVMGNPLGSYEASAASAVSPQDETNGKHLRKQLTTYEAYSIRPSVIPDTRHNTQRRGTHGWSSFQKHTKGRDMRNRWAEALIIQEYPPQSIIEDTVQKLDHRRPIIGKMNGLSPNKLSHVSGVLNDKLEAEHDPHFAWEVAQIQSNFMVRRGRKSTESINVYLRRYPRPEVETNQEIEEAIRYPSPAASDDEEDHEFVVAPNNVMENGSPRKEEQIEADVL